MIAASDSHRLETLLCTAEFTVERNRTIVTCVKRHLVGLEVYTDTWESTRETNLTSVHCVTKVSANPATCSYTNVVYTATEDHISVLTVGSCLRQTLIWSFMFVFTVVQSRTHVDTVQTVLQGVTNSRHICWSHTMKVLGWHVRFARRSSARVGTLRNIYVDTKVWSRLFAVNVQSVSVQQVNWNLISQFTRTSNSFAVVNVVKISHVNTPLKRTSTGVLVVSTFSLWTSICRWVLTVLVFSSFCFKLAELLLLSDVLVITRLKVLKHLVYIHTFIKL